MGVLAGVKFEGLRLDGLFGLFPAAGMSTSSSWIFTGRIGTPESWTKNSPRSAAELLRPLLVLPPLRIESFDCRLGLGGCSDSADCRRCGGRSGLTGTEYEI